MKARECRSEVTAVRALTPEIIEVDLKILEPTDFTFEAIGREATAQQGLAMTGMQGTLTMVGLMHPPSSLNVSAIDLMMGKTVRQSIMGSARSAADIPAMVEHALAGRLELGAMIGDMRPLDDVATVLDDLEHGRVVGRAVIAL